MTADTERVYALVPNTSFGAVRLGRKDKTSCLFSKKLGML